MRAIALSAVVLGLAAPASAQMLAGASTQLDCRPITETIQEKGVTVTRSFRAEDKVIIGTVAGHHCYAPKSVQMVAPQAPAQPQTVVIVDVVRPLNGFNVGTSPYVLGAPQPPRF